MSKFKVGDKVSFFNSSGNRVTGTFIGREITPARMGNQIAIDMAIVMSSNAFGKEDDTPTRCAVPMDRLERAL